MAGIYQANYSTRFQNKPQRLIEERPFLMSQLVEYIFTECLLGSHKSPEISAGLWADVASVSSEASTASWVASAVRNEPTVSREERFRASVASNSTASARAGGFAGVRPEFAQFSSTRVQRIVREFTNSRVTLREYCDPGVWVTYCIMYTR